MINARKLLSAFLLFLCIPVFGSATRSKSEAPAVMSLAGEWEVSLDSLKTFHRIALPGTLDMAGLGTPTSLTDTPRQEQWREVMRHLTRKHSFIGAAFYRRSIDISKEMAGKPLTLTLERVLWTSKVWIDGSPIVGVGTESLTTPHVYTIANGLKAGRHDILICIDNRKRYDISYEEMAHAYTDETQTKWNGVLGLMTLKAESPVKILSVQVFPNVADKSVKVRTAIYSPKKCSGSLIYSSGRASSGKALPCIVNDTTIVEETIAMGDTVKLWDEFSPNLYTINVAFAKAKKVLDEKNATFGMREIAVNDGHFAVNGNRIFLRGTLECCIFPLTGCPPTDEAGWEKVFKAAKTWGMNHLRFHSYCPPDAAFRVADRMGFYLQIELPVWSLHIGENSAVNAFLYNEYRRIVENYGNHPSFCLLSCGNELQPDFNFLNGFVHYMKQYDQRHLYTTSTFTFEKGHGRHPEPEDQYFVTQWTDNGWVRGQGVFDAEQPNFNKDYRTATKGINTPLVSHEVGQYSVYPNLREIDKYTGTLDPLNFKTIRNDLRRKGLLDKADDYLKASGRLAVQLYKEEIERTLKTPKFDGYQLLGLQDFPGQSTALVGLVDAFWDSKGLTTPEYFRQFNAPVVPLARFEKATWSSDETFKADIEIANYSKENLTGKKIICSLTDDEGKQVYGAVAGLVPDNSQDSVSFQTSFANITKATRLTLNVTIDGTLWHNTWNIWVYPFKAGTSTALANHGIVLTQDIDDALTALQKGKKVLLSPKKENVRGLEGKFLPVFWSPVHFPKQAGTMGLLVNPNHPALAQFPTEMNSDWQWWNLVKRSRVMVIDSLPGATPIIEDVDNFANNRRLASAFEAQCGKGKLLLCSMDVLSECEGMPEVKQLLYSLLSYMESTAFSPTGTVTTEQLMSLWDGTKTAKSTDANSIYE